MKEFSIKNRHLVWKIVNIDYKKFLTKTKGINQTSKKTKYQDLAFRYCPSMTRLCLILLPELLGFCLMFLAHIEMSIGRYKGEAVYP